MELNDLIFAKNFFAKIFLILYVAFLVGVWAIDIETSWRILITIVWLLFITAICIVSAQDKLERGDYKDDENSISK